MQAIISCMHKEEVCKLIKHFALRKYPMDHWHCLSAKDISFVHPSAAVISCWRCLTHFHNFSHIPWAEKFIHKLDGARKANFPLKYFIPLKNIINKIYDFSLCNSGPIVLGNLLPFLSNNSSSLPWKKKRRRILNDHRLLFALHKGSETFSLMHSD